MSFGDAVRSGFSKYVTFSGRASRSEYWWWALFIFAGQIILTFADSTLWGTVTTTDGGFSAQTSTPILTGIFILGTLLPSISVLVRRLHDKNRSGWWYWIILVPLVGIILLLYWFVTKGTDGPNDFGDDPLGSGFASSSIPHVDRE